MTQIDLPGGQGHQSGEGAPRFLLVSGAPIGAALFRTVQERLLPHGSVALEMSVPEVPPEQLLITTGTRMAETVAALGASVLFLHGTAAPLVGALPLGAAQHVVVSNGPLRRPDPILAGLSRLPTPALERALLRPEVLHRWLASSLGLRRAVTNPYAMHRDIVVMLCRSWTESPERRAEAARWIKAFAHPLPKQSDPGSQLRAIWGDHDPLHPVAELEEVATSWGGLDLLRVPGGRMFHVEERPWAVAEALVEISGRG